MSRTVLYAGAGGALAILAAIAIGALTGTSIGAAFLFAWLFWIGLPLGALPVLMGTE